MASDLARQLERIAPPRAGVSEKKGRPSLLLSARVAADTARHEVLQLGQDGFRALCALEPRFASFEGPLFSEAALDCDREMLTHEAARALDATLRGFLEALSPFFERECALQALEWLVRRFEVERRNVDAVIRCALPHHGTRAFVKVVQLMGPANIAQTRWGWLRALQRSGTPLARQSLVRAAARDADVLRFVCGMPASTAANTGAGDAAVRGAAAFFARVAVACLRAYPRGRAVPGAAVRALVDAAQAHVFLPLSPFPTMDPPTDTHPCRLPRRPS